MTNTTTKNFDKYLQSAIYDHKNNDIENAIAKYTEILKKSPENHIVLHALGIAFAQIKKYEKATFNFEKACNLDENNPHYQSSLGNLYRHLKKNDLAKKQFEKALEIEPKHISSHNNLAIVLYEQKKYQQSIKHYKKILAINANNADVQYNIALCYIKLKQYFQATEHLEKCCLIDEKHPKAHCQLAQIYHQEENYRKAEIIYQKQIENNPNCSTSLQNLGLLYLQMEKDDKAIEYLKKAYEVNSKTENINHNLGCVYLHKRKYQQALRHWLTHVNEAKDIDSYYNVGVCYLYLGRYEDASDYFFHVLKINKNHHKTLINLGACYLQQNKKDLAIEYYSKAYAIKPEEAIDYILSTLNGDNKKHSIAPKEYVNDLFDQYAHHYDNHLVNILSYKLPQHLLNLVQSIINPKENSLKCIDIGCGTGLTGVKIKPYCKDLTGIDISQNMLDKANDKKIYSNLIQGDILEILPTLEKVDCIIAADTIPYFGKLESLFEIVSSKIKKNGWWIFSIESQHCENYCIKDSARFSHSPKYIEQLSTTYKLEIISNENINLRTQQSSFVKGYLYCLKKI